MTTVKHEMIHREETMVFSSKKPAVLGDLMGLAKGAAVYILNLRLLFDEITSDVETGSRMWVYGPNGLRGYLISNSFLRKVRRLVPPERMKSFEPYLTEKPVCVTA